MAWFNHVPSKLSKWIKIPLKAKASRKTARRGWSH
jgi:hypothetical protein